MRDILTRLRKWVAEGEEIALATVIKTWGSSPRPVGAKMAVTHSGELTGSVSGGCVEGAVIEECMTALESGQSKILTYGVADETAWDVGLACGGTIQVYVEPFSAWNTVFDEFVSRVEQGQGCTVVMDLSENSDTGKMLIPHEGTTSPAALQPAIDTLLASGSSGLLQADEGRQFFVDNYQPQPHLVIVGAVHISEALSKMARILDFRVTILDPRSAFASEDRFSDVDDLVVGWPQRALPDVIRHSETYVAVLTHDPKIDVPALAAALQSDVKYVGALGSRKTIASRKAALHEAGLSTEDTDRLKGPIGLPLGGRSPQEIALSIMAEIVSVRNQSAS